MLESGVYFFRIQVVKRDSKNVVTKHTLPVSRVKLLFLSKRLISFSKINNLNDLIKMFDFSIPHYYYTVFRIDKQSGNI